jgi:two-component system, OmpR family, response regulator
VRVLVVEDEPKLARLLGSGLTGRGWATDLVDCGEDALWRATATSYDVIILDVLLPGVDGFATCRRLREADIQAPVLMLTALDGVAERIRGLDSGADDYLAKPFAFGELLARLRALTRRPGGDRAPVLQVGDLRLDPASHEVWRKDVAVELTPKEFQLLQALMRRPGQVLSRYALLESAWDEAYENRSNVIDVYVGYLRDKVDRPFGATSIQTIRGVGYRLAACETT